jgi:L1 cell adhesion molecule like protein
MAGLEVVRLISEPTAAAFHFGMTNKREERINVLVFDLGGGTLDVSILSIFENKYEVKSTKGDTHLGGKDFDDILVEHCAQKFHKIYEIEVDIRLDLKSMRKLRAECVEAKH